MLKKSNLNLVDHFKYYRLNLYFIKFNHLRLTKRFTPLSNNWITKYSRPKTNIIACLECGSYHEKGTVCGKCYESIKEKTLKMQEEMRNKSSN